MIVEAIKCPVCKDTIYSRVRHDYHYCTCESVSIDGGRDYAKVSWDPKIPSPEVFQIEIQATYQDLYNDWNYGIDSLGTIHDPSVDRDYVFYIPELDLVTEHTWPNLRWYENEDGKYYDAVLIGVL